MALCEFENGYWYLDELKDFATRICIPTATRLRKDELEKAIVMFLRTGKVMSPTKRSLRKTGAKDVDRGLSLSLRVENYTSNRGTKDFIAQQARMAAPDIQEKSGVWYRLNRWREEQISGAPTWSPRAAVCRPQQEGAIRKIHARSLHRFVAEFLATEKGATHAAAVYAWAEIKEMDVPKNYACWVNARRKRNRKCTHESYGLSIALTTVRPFRDRVHRGGPVSRCLAYRTEKLHTWRLMFDHVKFGVRDYAVSKVFFLKGHSNRSA
jgi:hypothetical protein